MHESDCASDAVCGLLDRLASDRSLSLHEYEELVLGFSPGHARYAAELAVKARQGFFDNSVYKRGLIEITNYCVNDCLYCGIRRSNRSCSRYRLSPEQVLECAEEGYDLGFRTFVLQGGEDPWFTDDRLCAIIRSLKGAYPDCALTLSLGERSRESYRKLRAAGADRYLLRHESADREHYERLHPAGMLWERRMRCLRELREAGFAVGAGFMVGSPFQKPEHLAADLKFVEEFRPDMCGIGPFISHHATPFAGFPNGSVELCCYLLSILRLIHPGLLLPATTALGTLRENGRELGVLSGANVVMPNLSPQSLRAKYEIYENKLTTGAESAQGRGGLEEKMRDIGYEMTVDRGDPPKRGCSSPTARLSHGV